MVAGKYISGQVGTGDVAYMRGTVDVRPCNPYEYVFGHSVCDLVLRFGVVVL